MIQVMSIMHTNDSIITDDRFDFEILPYCFAMTVEVNCLNKVLLLF